jgi:hypothetical protein
MITWKHIICPILYRKLSDWEAFCEIYMWRRISNQSNFKTEKGVVSNQMRPDATVDLFQMYAVAFV